MGESHTTSIQYSNIDLKIEKWKEFELQGLFEIKYGVNLKLINLTQSTGSQAINFVSRTSGNNGVVAKVLPVEGIEPQEAGLISVASGGSVLSTFYQDEPFYSGRDLYILKEKVPMSKLTKLFLCTVLEKNAYRYAYGRQANKTLKNIIVKVSVDSKGVIDDKYITNFMSKLQYSDMI